MSIHILRDSEIHSLILPNNFETSKVDGIICIEMFDMKYSDMICNLGIPVIFIDSAADIVYTDLKADLILMENEHSIYSITKKLIENGHRRFGFVGDYKHCMSFYERWVGYHRALHEFQLELDLSCCIVEEDRFFFSEERWMDKQLERMKQLPTAFIYANDFIAVSVLRALKNRNVKVPDDIVVCGFDNAPESSIVDPQLTTVHIFKNEMGIIAAEMLLSRVKNPTKPYQITYVRTEPIYRNSTGTLK